MQARDEHPARTVGAAVEDMRTEREFMDALRVMKARSGLSYRDIAMRMSRVAPRQAMAKSTLAALFAQDTLPRRPGQLTAIVDVLAEELAESADVAARYLAVWTRLMTARSALPCPARAGRRTRASGRNRHRTPRCGRRCQCRRPSRRRHGTGHRCTTSLLTGNPASLPQPASTRGVTTRKQAASSRC